MSYCAITAAYFSVTVPYCDNTVSYKCQYSILLCHYMSYDVLTVPCSVITAAYLPSQIIVRSSASYCYINVAYYGISVLLHGHEVLYHHCALLRYHSAPECH